LLLSSHPALSLAFAQFRNSSGFVMWVFYMVWMASLVCFCYALSTVFSTSKIAAVAGSLLYVLSWAPAVAATSGDGAHGNVMWTLVCVYPASSIYMWGLAVALLENAGVGVTWGSLFRNLTDSSDSSFSAGGVLLMTALGGAGSACCAWYLDKAAPREYGTRLPWWFVFSRTYWRSGHCGADAVRGGGGDALAAVAPAGTLASEDTIDPEDEEAAAALVAGAVERMPSDKASASVVLRRLGKWFAGPSAAAGRIVAVDNLSLSFYEGEITALLGCVWLRTASSGCNLSAPLPCSLPLAVTMAQARPRRWACYPASSRPAVAWPP
jgi:hypothetical protein